MRFCLSYLFLSGILLNCSLALNAQDFDNFVSESSESSRNLDKAITEYVREWGGLPIIEQDTVIFLAYSPHAQPRLSSGFNGFLSPRYISDPQAGTMQRIEESSWYMLKKHFPKDARIFYQIQVGDSAYNDPLNPRLGYRFTIINSELRMPEFEVHPELLQDQFIPSGQVSSIDFSSAYTVAQRKIQVYLPPDYDTSQDSYPVAYFHDGSGYVNMGKVPQILDNLIANDRIPPIIAVFDDPVNRGPEYRGDENYIQYIDHELIPFIDSLYKTKPNRDNRLIIGGSRGGLSSLILGHTTDRFSRIGVFSPAIHPRTMEDFIKFMSEASYHPDKVVILGARYDAIWYPDALALKEYFEQSSSQVQYLETSQGHNIQAWINYLDSILIGLLKDDRDM